MENDASQSNSHPQPDSHPHEGTTHAPVVTEHTEVAHDTAAHKDVTEKHVAEPEKAHHTVPVTNVEHKLEHAETKAEVKPEDHASTTHPHEAKTATDSHVKDKQPAAEETHEVKEHDKTDTKTKEATAPAHHEAEKKEASPEKPKETVTDDHKKPVVVEHKEAEKKEEVIHTKPAEAVTDDHKKPIVTEHKETEKKHEVSPEKPKEAVTDDHKKPAVTEHKEAEKKEEAHHVQQTTEQAESAAVDQEQAHPDASSPVKIIAEVHAAVTTDIHTHETEHKSKEDEAVTNTTPQEQAQASPVPAQDQTPIEKKGAANSKKESVDPKKATKPEKKTVNIPVPKPKAAVKKPEVERIKSDDILARNSEVRLSDGTYTTQDKILEVKKMKKDFEEQLRFLNKELSVLAHQEKVEKVLSAEIPRKMLLRDPLVTQKNSAHLLRPIDRSAFDPKAKSKLGRASTSQDRGEEAVEQAQEGSENGHVKLKEIKRVNRLNEEPLYLKMEKQFIEKVVCPELEMRKQALKQKREFSKPIELKEIKEHASKYQEVSKKELLTKQMARLEKEAIDHEKAEKVINVYKSSMLKKVLENDEEQKARDDKKAQEKKQRKDRQLQYGKLVKEMYKPKVDEALRQGLLEKIQAKEDEEALRRARQAKDSKTDYSGKTWKSKLTRGDDVVSTGNVDDIDHGGLGAKSRVEKFLTKPKVKKNIDLPETLPESELPDALKKINETLKEKIDKNGDGEEGSPEGSEGAPAKEDAEAKVKVHVVKHSPKKKERSIEREMEAEKAKEAEKPKKVYTNYLDDVRKKRIEQEKNGGKIKYGQWEKHLKNKDISYQDKVLNILSDVDRIEHQAKLKEERLKQHEHGSGVQPEDLEGQVTDMYLESIKAKLALIKGLQG